MALLLHSLPYHDFCPYNTTIHLHLEVIIIRRCSTFLECFGLNTSFICVTLSFEVNRMSHTMIEHAHNFIFHNKFVFCFGCLVADFYFNINKKYIISFHCINLLNKTKINNGRILATTITSGNNCSKGIIWTWGNKLCVKFERNSDSFFSQTKNTAQIQVVPSIQCYCFYPIPCRGNYCQYIVILC